MTDPLVEYIEAVKSGVIAVGLYQRLAIERHQLDLEIGRERGLVYDVEWAARAVDFFSLLRHTTGEYAGQPFKLAAWQRFVVGSLFGWRCGDRRRFREAYISVGRGNGKSTLAAGIGLELAFFDNPREPRAEVYVVATKKDQAKIVWEDAVRMAEASPVKRMLEFSRTSIYCPDNGSSFKPLGSDGHVEDGHVSHAVLFDELHAWRPQHQATWDKMVTSLGKRRQPMSVVITTAGDDMAELWKEQVGYSRRVLDQLISRPSVWFGDNHFAFICEVDKDDDPYDEGNWVKANPMLALSDSPVKIEHLRSMADKATHNRVAENRFRRYHLNQQVVSLEKPITPEVWELGSSPVPDCSGHMCYGGIDLARSDDFCAATLMWYLGEDTYAIRTWVWVTQDRSESLQTAEINTILAADNVTILPGGQIDFRRVREDIARLADEHRVSQWAIDDSWARETGQYLTEEHGLKVVAWPQTAKAYNEPVVRFIDLLSKGKIIHGNCPVLGWQAKNLAVRTNAMDLRMPDKVESDYKIDSVVAGFMAFGLALFDSKKDWTDEDRGL